MLTSNAPQWIGLCLTNNFMVFRIVSFICGITTVTPQLMIPLVGEYAPANKKGFVLSIIVSGLLLGMLIARLLSGILANYTSWRNIYWFACGAQYLIGTALFFFMPDYPSTNSGLGYFKALWTILCFIVTEPLLVQASLIVYFLLARTEGSRMGREGGAVNRRKWKKSSYRIKEAVNDVSACH